MHRREQTRETKTQMHLAKARTLSSLGQVRDFLFLLHSGPLGQLGLDQELAMCSGNCSSWRPLTATTTMLKPDSMTGSLQSCVSHCASQPYEDPEEGQCERVPGLSLLRAAGTAPPSWQTPKSPWQQVQLLSSSSCSPDLCRSH